MAADQTSLSGPPYEVETVRQLAELMSQHDLSEIDLSTGATRLRCRAASVRAKRPAARRQQTGRVLSAAGRRRRRQEGEKKAKRPRHGPRPAAACP